MGPIQLNKDGELAAEGKLVSTEPLFALGRQVLLDSDCTLQSFFKMIEAHPVFHGLSPFLPSYIEEYRLSPAGDDNFSGIERLELSRTVEMIGHPGPPSMQIFVSLEGFSAQGPAQIKSLGLDSLLNVPLRLGKLKHLVFGDKLNALFFDTVFNLFELIDGVCWELSFHNQPESCRLRP